MDNESAKAYASVIADAAEDSAPEHPVEYTTYPDADKWFRNIFI